MSYIAPRSGRTAGADEPRQNPLLRPATTGSAVPAHAMSDTVPGSLPAERPRGPAAKMATLRTFIVEDNALIRENLIATLEELTPVRVVGWADGEAAARRWLVDPREGFELIIVDIFLRDGSGLGVLQAAGGHAARRIVLSNYATRDIREACLASGADRVFDKSHELDELISYCQRLASGAPTTVPGGLG
jgi:CheY-like chemotaxis protein